MAVRPESHRAPSRGTRRAFGVGTVSGVVIALMLIAIVVTAAVSGETAVMVSLGALVVVVGVCGAVYGMLARNATLHDPAAAADPSGHREPVPGAPMVGQEDVAVGDTAEAHDEINPHDLPPDNPGREAAAEQSEGAEGETRGDAELNRAAPSRQGAQSGS